MPGSVPNAISNTPIKFVLLGMRTEETVMTGLLENIFEKDLCRADANISHHAFDPKQPLVIA